jgi:hypothetical protein
MVRRERRIALERARLEVAFLVVVVRIRAVIGEAVQYSIWKDYGPRKQFLRCQSIYC